MTDTLERPPPPGPPVSAPRGEIARGGWRLGLMIAATVALGVFGGYGWVVMIVAIIVMIFLHELGHFLTAKWAGMKVTEFFIGFGPKLWSFRRGETEYGVKAIPAGAYVRIIGMSNLEEVAPVEESRTYRQKSYPRRMSVALAGSTMHFIQALLCLVVLYTVIGVPGGTIFGKSMEDRERDWVIGSVSEDSAAERAGLREGDKLLAYDGDRIEVFEDVRDAVAGDKGKTVTLTVERDGRELQLPATIGGRPADAGGEPGGAFLGIGPKLDEELVTKPVHEAIGASVVDLGHGMRVATTALASFFTGGIGDFAEQVANGGSDSTASAPSEPSTPSSPSSGGGGSKVADDDGDANRIVSIYGMVRFGSSAIEDDFGNLFSMLVLINVFIGVFNLIPLLPLDGGHVAIATYERIRSTRERRYFADVAKMLPILYAVVVVLGVLGVSSLYLDIVDPIG